METTIYASCAMAFVISIVFTPILIRISRRRGFFASINHRSSHDSSVPNTGGIILCFSVLFSLLFFSDYPTQDDFSVLISAFAVLLITGIIDDFNPIPVAFKFLGQFIPAIVIVTAVGAEEFGIPFLSDYFQVPVAFNYLFWIVFIVMCINAFNLIDGIDGLAIGLGIICSVFYFFIFKGFGDLDLMIFSISLGSGLLGLLFYNISKKNKIFLGDTGSLLIGGLLVYFALRYINISNISEKGNAFFMVIASIFIPLADMIRVTLVRVLKGDSPFKADRQHIHHIVLDLLHDHHKFTAGVLLLSQIGIIYIFDLFADSQKTNHLLIIIVAFIAYFGITLVLQKLAKVRS